MAGHGPCYDANVPKIALIACFAAPLAWAQIYRGAPSGGPEPYLQAPSGNSLTREKVELGRKLFLDARLSSDQSHACASCHNPKRAFADGRVAAEGVYGRHGTRNTPSLVNRGWGRIQFWDGRAETLEQQALMPIQDPNEMKMTGGRDIAPAGRCGLPVAFRSGVS
jgi:cytochrome c peroxidase